MESERKKNIKNNEKLQMFPDRNSQADMLSALEKGDGAGFVKTKSENIIVVQRYYALCGDLLLGSFEDKLCLCDWRIEKHCGRVDRRLECQLNARFEEGTSKVTARAASQLDEYFAGRRKKFDIPLLFTGTEFQQAVWNGLLEVPYGTTTSYAALASRLCVPKAVRAVANANGANAVSIFIPCHRIIGSDGSLTGYGGGLEAKKFLLNLESGPQWQLPLY